jgi:hypothetical protein
VDAVRGHAGAGPSRERATRGGVRRTRRRRPEGPRPLVRRAGPAGAGPTRLQRRDHLRRSEEAAPQALPARAPGQEPIGGGRRRLQARAGSLRLTGRQAPAVGLRPHATETAEAAATGRADATPGASIEVVAATNASVKVVAATSTDFEAVAATSTDVEAVAATNTDAFATSAY